MSTVVGGRARVHPGRDVNTYQVEVAPETADVAPRASDAQGELDHKEEQADCNDHLQRSTKSQHGLSWVMHLVAYVLAAPGRANNEDAP